MKLLKLLVVLGCFASLSAFAKGNLVAKKEMDLNQNPSKPLHMTLMVYDDGEVEAESLYDGVLEVIPVGSVNQDLIDGLKEEVSQFRAMTLSQTGIPYCKSNLQYAYYAVNSKNEVVKLTERKNCNEYSHPDPAVVKSLDYIRLALDGLEMLTYFKK